MYIGLHFCEKTGERNIQPLVVASRFRLFTNYPAMWHCCSYVYCSAHLWQISVKDNLVAGIVNFKMCRSRFYPSIRTINRSLESRLARAVGNEINILPQPWWLSLITNKSDSRAFARKRRHFDCDAHVAAENKRTWQPLWVIELVSIFMYTKEQMVKMARSMRLMA